MNKLLVEARTQVVDPLREFVRARVSGGADRETGLRADEPALTRDSGRARRPRVIAGVDGSPHSAAALAWAAADARLRGEDLLVVTACPPDAAPAGPGTSPAAAGEQACRQAQARLLAGLPASAAPPARALVLPGDPVTVLITAAAAGDVLVVGTRGRGRLRSLLLGSVAQGCAEQAPCPVVVVPSPPPGAALAPARGPVVAGVGSSPEARAALRFAAAEAILRGAELLPVHAVYPDYATAQACADTESDNELLSPLDSAWAQLEMLVRAELADLNVTVQPVAVCGDPATVLLRWTQSAALVAIGTRGAGRLHAALPGSVIARLLRHAPCPIAVVPDGTISSTCATPPAHTGSRSAVYSSAEGAAT